MRKNLVRNKGTTEIEQQASTSTTNVCDSMATEKAGGGQTGLRSRGRRFLGGVGFLRTLVVRVFYPTPEVQLNHFLHRTPKLGILTRACWNGTISFETFIETDNSCRVPRFPLIASCYKIVDSQTSFMLCSRSRKFWKGRSWTFYLRLRNPDTNATKYNAN